MKAAKYSWNIIGHDTVVTYLQNSLNQEIISHAYLFEGMPGLGKSTVAGLFCQSVICQSRGTETSSLPCRECFHCRQFEAQTFPEQYTLERDAKIEDIKQLQSSLAKRSFSDTHKIIIVHDAHTLTASAANAMLKTLEEPHSHTIFVLITPKISQVPKTIVSRCQVVSFRAVKKSTIYDFLVEAGAERTKAQHIARISGGRPGISLQLHQNQRQYDEYKKLVNDCIVLLNEPGSRRLKKFQDYTKENDALYSQKDKAEKLLDIWLSVVRDIMLMRLGLKHVIRHEYILPAIERAAHNISFTQLKKIFAEIKTAKRHIAANVQPAFAFESLLLSF